MTTLRFIGDWHPLYGAALAAVLAAAAWWLYRREVRARRDALRWLLPALRALATALLVLMLSGPILHHRATVGRTGRILIVADASKSLSVNDAAMNPGRKLLVASSLGLLPRGILNEDPLAAERALLAAEIAAQEQDRRKLTAGVVRAAQQANDRVGAALRNEFRQEVLDAAFALERAPDSVLPNSLASLLEKIARWRVRLREAAEAGAMQTSGTPRPEITEALKRFGALTRWQRLQALLLGGGEPLLATLARTNHVEAVALEGATAQALWSGRAAIAPGALPKEFMLEPAAMVTDLALGLQIALERRSQQAAAAPGAGPEPLAVVLLSDGRHNHGDPPLAVAKTCGERAIPVFTVGLGADLPPRDLAVDRVEAPQWLYHKDHLRGRVVLKDDMPAGRPFTLRILCGTRVLWEQAQQTTGEHQRAVDFDFTAEDYLKEKLSREPGDVTRRSFALELRAAVSGLEKEDPEPRNDTRDFQVRATFQRSRILILDGRPRWEFRYLRDLFERDSKWEVTAIVVDPLAPEGGLRRGAEGGFPASRESLFTYDLVVMGDFPAQALRPEELTWLRDFIAQRGGGLILIDGDRGNLRRYNATPLGELVPIAWSGAGAAPEPSALRLTEKGRLRLTRQGLDVAALTLAPDAAASAAIWNSLLPPHWLAPATPLPGAEVLLEAVAEEKPLPALVSRRYGAGKVLYAAFDESWRFRYRVADLHHSRYWSQVAGWIMAPAYAASDRFVSLDAGALVYNAGSGVELRARVRDAQGKAVMGAAVIAHITREGREVASLPLAPEAESGEYRGNTNMNDSGRCEVSLEVTGYAREQLHARTEFYVRAPEAGELTEISCDEALLKQIAAASGGEYFREENARDLAARVQPFLAPRVIESETVLWQSYWWFGALALLFTLEWVLRKKAGML